MQEDTEFVKFIKKGFRSPNFASTFVASLISIFIIILIGVGLVWSYRANIFGYFAKEYLQEAESSTGTNKNTEETALTQDSFVVDAVKKTNPAVVSVIISEEVPKYEEIQPSPDQNQDNNPFGDMFPGFNIPGFNMNVPQYQQDGIEKQEVGGGSGFLISADGLIVTNKHVVDQANATYTVFTNDGKKHDATVVAKDPVLDIALIKIAPPANGAPYPYLTLGDSDTLQVGQSVIAIGNALGEFSNTVSVGVVSGLSRSITAGDDSTGSSEVLDHVIQTDAAINPGNSGGPLLDLSGNVIGVNVAVAENSQSIGFALPINSVKSAIESVEQTGKIVRPYLGLRYVDINSELQTENNLPVDYGVLVQGDASQNELAVIPGSPADKAGIVENDIILDVDGVKLDDTNDLADVIRSKKIGQNITMTILHKGVQKDVQVTLAAAPDTTPTK